MSTPSLRRLVGVGLMTAALTGATFVTSTAAPGDLSLQDTEGFRKAVTLQGVREHQAAFQKISDENGGNRAAGSPGYARSADYVEQKLKAAGYRVSRHSFSFLYNADRTPPVLQTTSPTQSSYVDGIDYSSMTFSGNGDVTAAVVAVDLVVPPGAPNSSTSGCEAADFAGFPAGSIALIQRGTCSFAQKVANATAAGAAASVIFNEGQSGRTAALAGTLGGPVPNSGPAIGTSFDVGNALRNGVNNGRTGVTARVKVDRVNEERITDNVIAETRTGDPDSVVVVGAHLDSVPRGAGINDNGSGSAGILEIAEQVAARDLEPRNKVRFMWFGAEEFGLLGSRAYVDSLSQAELDKITLNLNFDMIGSPNYVRFVYDGDNSAFPEGPGAAKGPQGSGEIERVFHDYFNAVGLASAETPFSGRSDYGPFIAKGIPAGGLFTGAEGVKTAEQAAIFGGTAGQSYDPCYHLACDDFSNVSMKGLDEMVDAAATATLVFARRNYEKYPLVNPSTPVTGTTGTPGGGGLHDEHDHEEVDR